MSSPTFCTTCNQTNTTFYLYNGSCITNSSCPNGTYPNSTTLKCQTCTSPCSSCLNSLSCIDCTSGFYLNGSSCLSSCPNGTVAQNISSGGVCQQCSFPCTSCMMSPTYCLTCNQTNSTLYLYNGSCLSNSSCLNGTYANQTTLTCSACSPACSSCSSQTLCFTCNPGFYYSNNTCLSTCPNGTVGENST